MSGRTSIVLLLVAAMSHGCSRKTAAPPAIETQGDSIQTIQQVGGVPPLPLPADTASQSALAPLVDLPFAPAISMDPVDGSKISIGTDTPVVEYKDRVYYFQNEQNRQTFLKNPQRYASGSLAKY